ncbi:hypothetical protein ACFU9B_31105 [Streptomyces sp. NPDC057592]|uniref:hypothetical protein n=1 Tax=unclassified Streptomyces TaxID=2593676 RepID=UPI003695C428
MPVTAVGLITEPDQAPDVVTSGQADTALPGHEILPNPYWARHAAAELGSEAPTPSGTTAHDRAADDTLPHRLTLHFPVGYTPRNTPCRRAHRSLTGLPRAQCLARRAHSDEQDAVRQEDQLAAAAM